MFAARAPCCGTCSSGEVHRGVEQLGIAKASSAPADENITAAPVVSCVATAPAGYAVPSSVVLQPCATTAPVAEQRVSVEAVYISPASAVIGSPEVEYVALAPAVRSNHAMCTPRHLPVAFVAPAPAGCGLLLRQQGRCGVTFADCCWGSRDVAASYSQTAVAAAETLRRQLADCCCGSRDVAASHSQTAVAAADMASHSLIAVAAAETLQLPEFSAEQRWKQCCPCIDCESSFSGQRLSKCLWSGIPQIRRWCQIIEICCDV